MQIKNCKLNSKKEKIADILRDNQNTAELQRQQQNLERQLEHEKMELADANKQFLKCLVKCSILL